MSLEVVGRFNPESTILRALPPPVDKNQVLSQKEIITTIESLIKKNNPELKIIAKQDTNSSLVLFYGQQDPEIVVKTIRSLSGELYKLQLLSIIAEGAALEYLSGAWAFKGNSPNTKPFPFPLHRQFGIPYPSLDTEEILPTDPPILIMESVTGVTLEITLNKIKATTNNLDDRLLLASKICEAVQTLNELGLYHRDLKPSNIIVKPNGDISVIDFGSCFIDSSNLSQKILEDHLDTFLQAPISATLPYAPLEISCSTSRAHYAKNVDIFALGAIIYEILKGEQLFRGSCRSEIEDQKRGVLDMIKNARELPEGFAGLIAHAVCPIAGDRFQSVKQLIKAFAELRPDIQTKQLSQETLNALCSQAKEKVDSNAPTILKLPSANSCFKSSLAA
ncbi:MAG TPA: protein kinase [Oligoflexia bacterium]|nr:protein kinase [Oligoflexia bacterium]HMP26511.1 protein kinase [Oligoflexia bacterium]